MKDRQKGTEVPLIERLPSRLRSLLAESLRDVSSEVAEDSVLVQRGVNTDTLKAKVRQIADESDIYEMYFENMDLINQIIDNNIEAVKNRKIPSVVKKVNRVKEEFEKLADLLDPYHIR